MTEQDAIQAYRRAAPHDAGQWLMAVQCEDVWCVGLMSEDGIRGRVYPDGRVEVTRQWGETFERVVTEGRAIAAVLVWVVVGIAVGVLRALGVISPHAATRFAGWWLVPVVVVGVLVFFVPLAWGWVRFLVYDVPVGTWRWLKKRMAA
jgi:hypothetical protein